MSDKPKTVKGSTIKKVEAKGKLRIATFEKNGHTLVVKGWEGSPFIDGLKEGEVAGEHPEIELKPGKYGDELFFKAPPRGGGRGGGIAKSDPEKNKIISEANRNNNETMARANRLNNAVKAIESASTLVVARINSGQFDFAKDDEAAMVRGLAEALFQSAEDMADGKTLRGVINGSGGG